MLVLLPEELRNYAELDNDNKFLFIGMGNKFEIWNTDNWNLRQTGGTLATEILDVVLPISIIEMSF
jgi:MraZ protein